jgi:hypothetical protein
MSEISTGHHQFIFIQTEKSMSWEKVEKDVTGGPLGLFKWVAIGVVLIVLLFGGINLIMKPATMAVDRVVMKNSFQYREGMEQRGAILEASLVELDIALQQNPENRQGLVNQKRILSAQLRAITINK